MAEISFHKVHRIFNEPYERWFGTMRQQFVASLDMRNFHDDLDEMRKDFAACVDRYYRTVHSSFSGKTPPERFFSEPEQIRRLTQALKDIRLPICGV